MNIHETEAETVARLFGVYDPNATVTLDQLHAFRAERNKIDAARKEAEAQASTTPPPTPPPSPEDRVGQLRQRAADLQRERDEAAELRRDAETLAYEIAREQGFQLTDEDVAEMSDDDLLRLTGLDGERPQHEIDNDLAANIEAAENGPRSFGETATETAQKELDAERSRVESWGANGG